MSFSRRVRLQIAYDGTDFVGWQKQKNGKAIQNHLEEALGKIFSCEVKTIGSGRTDAGVHAFDQNAHFDLPKALGDFDLIYSLNSLLPKSIVIKKAWQVPASFHALHSAQEKIYRYRILQGSTACPLRRHFTWHLRQKLETEKLNLLSEILVGQHDFKSFQSTGTKVATTIRKVLSARWQEEGDELIFIVKGNGFLKQMVRNIVGTVVALALEGRGPEELLEILASKDRRKAAPPAPPQGLYLQEVVYPHEILTDSQPLF